MTMKWAMDLAEEKALKRWKRAEARELKYGREKEEDARRGNAGEDSRNSVDKPASRLRFWDR